VTSPVSECARKTGGVSIGSQCGGYLSASVQLIPC
jgi:hypothetical protein